MTDDNEQLSQFEKLGVDEVDRLVNASRYSAAVERLAIRWLAQKSQESRLRNEASNASQERTALSAKKAAWIAAIAAIVAAVIAIIGIIVTILTWLFPHQ